jgi:hypothetical protein
MPAIIQYEPNDVCLLRINGILRRTELGACEDDLARQIDAGSKPRLLAILENFEGWERGVDWNDLGFMLSCGEQIRKIAIVGEARWEVEALAFAGAGFRRASVRFFPSDQQAEARAWVEE